MNDNVQYKIFGTRQRCSPHAYIGRRIPIIAVTANAMKGDSERYFVAGRDGYVTKPIKKENPAEVIRESMEWFLGPG